MKLKICLWIIGRKRMLDNCTLTKIYSFSAAHRLHNDKFTEKKNKEIFGKCNNPNGHGHDYSLELTLGGEVDELTGMIIDIVKLDEIVGEVIEELDHKRLDIEIEYFTSIRASGENIAKYLWDKIVVLIPKPAYLYHVRLWETSENFFDYKDVS